MPLLLLLMVTVAFDLGTKSWAEATLIPYLPVGLSGEWLRLTLLYNEGIAFGLFATNGPGVIIISGIATALLAIWLLHGLRTGSYPLPAPWALGILVGGALANFLDRIVDGRVTDFIDIGIGAHRWATFNFADFFVLFGIAMLVLKSYQDQPETQDITSGGEFDR